MPGWVDTACVLGVMPLLIILSSVLLIAVILVVDARREDWTVRDIAGFPGGWVI